MALDELLLYTADPAPWSAGKDAASAPAFLSTCAFLDAFTLRQPMLDAADPEMRDGALPSGEAQRTWGHEIDRKSVV